MFRVGDLCLIYHSSGLLDSWHEVRSLTNCGFRSLDPVLYLLVEVFLFGGVRTTNPAGPEVVGTGSTSSPSGSQGKLVRKICPTSIFCSRELQYYIHNQNTK